MNGSDTTIASASADETPAWLSITEKGQGPGILLLDDDHRSACCRAIADRWSQEGYVVLAPAISSSGTKPTTIADVVAAILQLREMSICTGKVGILAFGIGANLALAAAAQSSLDALVAYDPTQVDPELLAEPRCPTVIHLAAEDAPKAHALGSLQQMLGDREKTAVHVYRGVRQGFARVERLEHHLSAANLAYSRSLACFRDAMGPKYDLSSLWERHVALEFEEHDADATMATMTRDAYVNHVPTMTGGYGFDQQRRFYAHHFIPTLPRDAVNVLVSRTLGVSRIVDEMVLKFTHDTEVDFILPGVKPTGRRVEIPIVAVVEFRGDKVAYEHLHWDQASVLVQLGLLDPTGLPIAGVETTHKFLDPSLPPNTLMKRWAESEGK